jgi:RimJ/RimL family protein N-acetyltransferase
MELRALKLSDMGPIRRERNALPDGILRTPFLLTSEMQEEWYFAEIANRKSTTRYWALQDNNTLVGYGGIENISWENGTGEISLLIFQNHKRQGFGAQAVRLFLDRAFNYLRLGAVVAEVYGSNPNSPFWERVGTEHNAHYTVLPHRKFVHGRYYGAEWYTFTKERYDERTEDE